MARAVRLFPMNAGCAPSRERLSLVHTPNKDNDMFKRLLLLIATWLLLPLAASASPITYTYSGTGSGALAGTAFMDTAFVITAQGDTDNIAPWANATWQNTHSTASIQIDGLGTFAFTVPTHTWIASNCCLGFGINLGSNLLTFFDAAIADVGYALDTSFASTLDINATTQGQFNNIGTSGGALSITSLDDGASFSASTGTAVPEPGSLAVVLLGLGLVGWTRRGVAAR
jgi:hypothetical protein